MRAILRHLLVAGAVLLAPDAARAQWVTTYEQFYLPAAHNWMFRNEYQSADRLFNAFDYGHAILYETLWTRPDAPASLLEEREYDYLTRRVLVRPPRVPLEEARDRAAVRAARARGEADVRLGAHAAPAALRRARRRAAGRRGEGPRGRARSSPTTGRGPTSRSARRPKSMALMQEQPYSLAFRQKYPKFNGLIWGYHWLQVGLYEPLLVGRTAAERQAGVRAHGRAVLADAAGSAADAARTRCR